VQNAGLSAQALADLVLHEVGVFADGQDPFDDATLLIVKRVRAD
jgi:serine phosphatase RsbU (regulator of sigma subunit)